MTTMTDKNLRTEIIFKMKAGGAYMTGDILFWLAFRTREELIAIARELYVVLPEGESA